MSPDSSSPARAAPVVEFCITGDEVLRGVIADTNSALTAAKLYPMGFALRRTTVVGDRGEDIRRALLEIAARAEFCIVSGGLGPTSDDLTAACAAQAAGVELVRDDEWLSRMRERWAKRRTEPMPPNNERQAWLPAGCERLGNPDGSAPAFALRIDRCQFFFLPGVPREYHRIIDELVLPRLARALPEQAVRARTLQCIGIAESALDQAVAPIRLAHPGVRFGFRTKFPENHLSLVARAGSGDEAARLLAAAEQACRDKLGSHVYAEDGLTFAQSIGNLLVARRETLCCAESCTGGLLSQLCTEFAGSSRFFQGGFIHLLQRAQAAPPLRPARGARRARRGEPRGRRPDGPGRARLERRHLGVLDHRHRRARRRQRGKASGHRLHRPRRPRRPARPRPPTPRRSRPDPHPVRLRRAPAAARGARRSPLPAPRLRAHRHAAAHAMSPLALRARALSHP